MRYLVRIVLTAALIAAFAPWFGCNKPPAENAAPESSATPAPQPTGLDAVPAPEPSQYLAVKDLKDWKNPYLIVRGDGIGFVDLDNHEIHILKIEEVPAKLNSLPLEAWPYGRIVLVGQAVPEDASDATKAELRKSRGLLVGTLKDLKVVVKEAP